MKEKNNNKIKVGEEESERERERGVKVRNIGSQERMMQNALS